MKTALLCTAYLPPIQYFTKFFIYDEILIEQYESFPKQTYRNRCYILTSNGKQPLIIPAEKGGSKQFTKDVKISYSIKWQKLHWLAIVSAYNNSPFFEYYSDYFRPFYEKQYKYLIDYNWDLLALILSLLKMDIKVLKTGIYMKNPQSIGITDFRSTIHPKIHKAGIDTEFVCDRQYTQVFSNKYGFIPNLSIIDLLFNLGKEAKEYLQQSSRTLLHSSLQMMHDE